MEKDLAGIMKDLRRAHGDKKLEDILVPILSRIALNPARIIFNESVTKAREGEYSPDFIMSCVAGLHLAAFKYMLDKRHKALETEEARLLSHIYDLGVEFMTWSLERKEKEPPHE